MINIVRYEDLGRANYGWLDARYHFSFAGSYNPERMGFGALRVVNDDSVAPGAGFPTHPHRDMEIITYVRQGAITHADDQGNQGRTEAGDVQVMSAGRGIQHSEMNLESVETKLYQIWIFPNKRSVNPHWETHKFPKVPVKDSLPLLVAGDGSAPLAINQDAYIYAGRLASDASVVHSIKHQAYILIAEGEIEVQAKGASETVNKGDAIEVTKESEITLSANTESEVLIIDVPDAAHRARR